ncbi:glycosyltransferase family A protein [Bosea sp. (in: a-proteobacteria)]|uniref:glycosyltransferase family 2 protein n=1 Tax=Bosea sp. (in: a-proteobacteria) TaxID=1871050 RepID=UPI0025C35F64|nr:glycosyltransferase family A protein [Bosea sp. (in: a-proteobacteria)]
MSNSESRPSAAARPRFSVLIPTRDRPSYVRNALESVLEQSFDDFEVIVCDNYKKRSCKPEVEAFGDPRVRYLNPSSALAMHDNWEFAIDQARGDFVLVLIDKTLLRLNALERLQAATLSHPAEIYSWTSDAYYLTHEQDGDVGQGYLVPVRAAGEEPFYVDCKEEMAARVSFRTRLGSEGPSYAYGKICFGAFSRTLISKIKARFGKVCPLISPDYTSKTLALLSTDKLVDLNNSCAVHLNTQISNGMLFSQNTVHARSFLAEAGWSEAEFADLPIPHVFCSLHNICAYDWRMIDQDIPGHDYRTGSLDLAAVYVQTQLDLDAVRNWASEEEKQTIFGHMEAFLQKAPIELRERIHAFRTEFIEAALVKREAAVRSQESWVKSREDHVTWREKAALEREVAVSLREENVRRHQEPPGPALRAYREARRLWREIRPIRNHAPVDPPVGLEAPTQRPDIAIALGPTVNGYPSFRTTIAALRYAESKFYAYPLPQPAPAGAF